MVPLALTRPERRLAAGAAVAACIPACVAAVSLLGWCIGAAEDELLGATLVGLALFAPTWMALAAGLRLAGSVREAWMDTRALPRPAVALCLAAPLVILTTSYERLEVLDPWRWASLLPALAARLVLAALASTLRRRWRRRGVSRWSASPLR